MNVVEDCAVFDLTLGPLVQRPTGFTTAHHGLRCQIRVSFKVLVIHNLDLSRSQVVSIEVQDTRDEIGLSKHLSDLVPLNSLFAEHNGNTFKSQLDVYGRSFEITDFVEVSLFDATHTCLSTSKCWLGFIKIALGRFLTSINLALLLVNFCSHSFSFLFTLLGGILICYHLLQFLVSQSLFFSEFSSLRPKTLLQFCHIFLSLTKLV